MNIEAVQQLLLHLRVISTIAQLRSIRTMSELNTSLYIIITLTYFITTGHQKLP